MFACFLFSLSLSKLLLIWLSHSDLSYFFSAACGVGVGHSLRAMAFFAFCQFEELGLGGEGGEKGRGGMEGVGFFFEYIRLY